MTAPSNELVKDMYAEFGLTYYYSEVLCEGLGIFHVLMSFKNISDITKPRYEEKLVEVSHFTLGIVIEKVKPLVSLDLQSQLDEALERRNYIAHYFWYERIPDMFSEVGVQELILELRKDRGVFERIDQQIRTLIAPRLLEMGLTDEVIEAYSQRIVVGELEPPLPSKLPLSRKMICIVKAYDIPTDNVGLAQVFETDDGEFLQFCDVGLGWSNFPEVQANWKVNEVLQQYLPAYVVPRPDILEPWNYEIRLPHNAVLWVKRGRTEKTYKWGIRSEK